MKKIKPSEYKKRTTCPSKDNPLFIMKKYGGKSPCIQGNPILKEGYVLPNCVGYSYGRFWEIADEEIRVGTAKGLDYPQSANVWWTSNDGLERGQVPKLGAVCCWSTETGKTGHCAIVEEIKEDKSIVVSESLYGYGDVVWRLRTIKYPYNYGKEIFRGFIYNPAVEDEVKPTPTPKPVDELRVGDIVIIKGIGNSQASGLGRQSYGLGWTRTIRAIYEGKPYPYLVGTSNGYTGFYKKEGLKKV